MAILSIMAVAFFFIFQRSSRRKSGGGREAAAAAASSRRTALAKLPYSLTHAYTRSLSLPSIVIQPISSASRKPRSPKNPLPPLPSISLRRCRCCCHDSCSCRYTSNEHMIVPTGVVFQRPQQQQGLA